MIQSDFVRRLFANRLSALGFILLLAIILAIVIGPLVWTVDPNAQNLAGRIAGPSAAHPFGTDSLGRDVLSRILGGGRTTLLITFITVVLSGIIGAAIGLVAGYFGGVVDAVLMRVNDVMLALPFLLLALMIAAAPLVNAQTPAKQPAAAPAAGVEQTLTKIEHDILAALLKKDAAVKVEDGKYFDAEGHPTFDIANDGKKLDWYSYSGYRRYHAECHVCHGPDGMGSTYAPALKDSLKHLSYEEFIGILVGGKQDINAAEQKVMPAFGDNKNVMCYSDDLYVYLKARSAGALGRVRPSDKEDKPEAAKKAEKECMGG